MRSLLLAAGMIPLATAVLADRYSDVMGGYAHDHGMTWAADPAIVAAIRAQNDRTAGLAQDDIDSLDLTWRQEIGKRTHPTIDAVLANPVSDMLRARVAESDGVVTEVFIMDARGLNVASSAVTSDYWQGDEAKFSETFGRGAGAMHVGEIEFDVSTQSYQGQVSVAVTDPDSGRAIGAITVGLNAEMLF